MQPTYMRSVSFWGKFTSGSRISASRSDLLKVPIVLTKTAAQQPCSGHFSFVVFLLEIALG